MMRKNVRNVEESSEEMKDSDYYQEIEEDYEVEGELLSSPHRVARNAHPTIRNKIGEVRSIYMENKAQQQMKAPIQKKKSMEEKINADELIKVLQNGRERRNQRRTKFDDPDEKKATLNGKEKFSEQYNTEGLRKASKEQNYPERDDDKPLIIRETKDLYEKQKNQKKFAESKLINELKEEKKRSSMNKNEAEWKEIQSLLNSTKGEKGESSYRRNERRQELEVAKELLTGKVSIIWIFIIRGAVSEEDRNRILKIYSGLSNSRYVAPLVQYASQIDTFLEIPNSLFKIVTDLDNARDALRFKINAKVMEFFILNNEAERGIAKALNIKCESRKVKGIFSTLEKIIDRAEEEIENQIQLYFSNNGLIKKKIVKRFPSFLKLSGQDKTYATLYRANLYGSKNIPKSELKERFLDFMEFVGQKYKGIEREQKNIKLYESLNHFVHKISQKQARQIIRFYVKESFYYQILNSMLRTMKTTEQFRPCIFPFYENYHSVKFFYKGELEQNNRKVKAQTLYRGAKLRPRDYNSLKPGVYIQMFGFMSTSKNLQRAREFTDRDGYIFIITIPELQIPKKFDKYDHGFVDINKYSLADKQFQIEEQVLFNALNIYKVLNTTSDGEYNYIHLEYGSIFGLLKKEKTQLTSDEKDVLLNYQHCSHLLDEIEDQGDVHLLANEFEESKEYYAQKLKDKSEEGKYLYKLANVQQQCGELEQASKNVKNSLQLQMKELNLNDREKCLKVFSIHSKNAQISLDKEDYLTADTALTQAIELLVNEEDEFEKAKKIRERGEIKFKKGEIREAEKDFSLSETIFRNLNNKAEEKRRDLNKTGFSFFFSLICSSNEDIQDGEKEEKLKEIEELEKKINDMKEEIDEELIKVNNSLKEAAIYAEDKDRYEIYVKRSRAYLLEIQSRQSNDPREKARLKAMEATIQDYLELAETEILLQDAINLIESNEPFDPTVGKYSEVLASLQKKELEKFSNPKAMASLKLEPGKQKLKYNETEHQQVYNKSKQNFQKALNILLYNTKTQSSPEVLSIKNQMGELDFNESNYEASEKIIREVKEQKNNAEHSEISKSCLLLSKISYARGELRDSFQNVEEALRTLKCVLVKKDEPTYLKIFQGHSITLQVKIHRCKIYLRQLNHDLCLKDIESIRSVIKNKSEYSNSSSLLADLMELEGENQINWKGGGDFDDYFLDAIKLREKQMGAFNLANAVTYANFSKHLILAGDLQEGQKMLEKSLEIFGCFSDDHPITWLVLYCAGLFNERKQNVEESIKYLKRCLSMATKKFDKSHITLNKIRLQYGKILHEAKKFSDAIRELELLEDDIDQELIASSHRNHTQNEKDDEKISVKKYLYTSLRQSYKAVERDHFDLNTSKSKLDFINRKMDDLNRTYRCYPAKQKEEE